MAYETDSANQTFEADEHTVGEIENLKANLEAEIQKKEEQLKTVISDKYRDIVEVTDTIHGMRDHVNIVESTLRHLSEFIADFKHIVDAQEDQFVEQSHVIENHKTQIDEHQSNSENNSIDDRDYFDNNAWLVLKHIDNIWIKLETGEFKDCVLSLGQLEELLKNLSKFTPDERKASLIKFETALEQTRCSITDKLTGIVNKAPPDQVGLMHGEDNDELYDFCLIGAIKQLVQTFRDKMSEASLASIIRKSSSIVNLDTIISPTLQTSPDSLPITSSAIDATTSGAQIKPEEPVIADISIDLHMFLFDLCHVMNKIAGCYLSRASLVRALGIAVNQVCQVYHDTLGVVDSLPASIGRKRILQLYFDLLYVRSITSTTKNSDLENDTVPVIEKVTSEYESRLDTMELYMISAQLQTNLANVCQRNKRLFGFLAPYG